MPSLDCHLLFLIYMVLAPIERSDFSSSWVNCAVRRLLLLTKKIMIMIEIIMRMISVVMLDIISSDFCMCVRKIRWLVVLNPLSNSCFSTQLLMIAGAEKFRNNETVGCDSKPSNSNSCLVSVTITVCSRRLEPCSSNSANEIGI